MISSGVFSSLNFGDVHAEVEIASEFLGLHPEDGGADMPDKPPACGQESAMPAVGRNATANRPGALIWTSSLDR